MISLLVDVNLIRFLATRKREKRRDVNRRKYKRREEKGREGKSRAEKSRELWFYPCKSLDA